MGLTIRADAFLTAGDALAAGMKIALLRGSKAKGNAVVVCQGLGFGVGGGESK